MSTNGEVRIRTSYYERIPRDGTERTRNLPFYRVLMPGWPGGGKLWEPVDAITNAATQTESGKPVHETVEWDGKADTFGCELKPDGKPLQLHKFEGWGWPQT